MITDILSIMANLSIRDKNIRLFKLKFAHIFNDVGDNLF